MKISVIIAAAGIGKRMGGPVSKQLIKINNKPVLYYSIKAFNRIKLIDEIIIVTNKGIIQKIENLVKLNKFNKVKKILLGGGERQQSIFEGLQALDDTPQQIVLIHDGVRPFIQKDLILEIIKHTKNYGAAVPAIPSKDTLKFSHDGKFFSNTPRRADYWLIQTPQGFMYPIIMKAHQSALKSKFFGSDDSSLVERNGINPKIVIGSERNIKITTPEDLKIAEFYFKK